MTSGSNVVSSNMTLPKCADIITNQPHPDRWVLVKQLNMETREPCEIWRSGVHNQIKKMRYQLAARSEELDKLNKEIQQTKLQCEETDSVTSDDNMTEHRNES